jgi:hypothetical protein
MCTMWDRPELQSMFVAQHWSAPCNFELACHSESAAQCVQQLRVSTLSQKHSAQRSLVWCLLNGELPVYATVEQATVAFNRRRDTNTLSSHPQVLPDLGEFTALRSVSGDARVNIAPVAKAGTSAGAVDAIIGAAADLQASQRPWLAAAGYLGRSLATMLSSIQASEAQDGVHGSVKCNQDEIADLVQQNKVFLAKPGRRLQVDGRQQEGTVSDTDSETDVNSTEQGKIQRKRKPGDLPVQRHTEMMGIQLQEVAGMHKNKKQKICKNAAFVQKALSDVRTSP